MSETSSELDGMAALSEGVAAQRWPHCMAATEWVKQWMALKKPDTADDEGAMLSWFANAIMAGHDTASMNAAKELAAQSARILQLEQALKEAKRQNGHREDCDSLCGNKCDCGADALDDKIDALLHPANTETRE